MSAFDVPAHVRTVVSSRGPSGTAWLASLDELVPGLLAEWELRLIGTLPGGSQAWLGRVLVRDGSRAVLKVSFRREQAARNASVLAAADGRGYVRLLRADAERGAELLEELGPSVAEQHLSAEGVLRVSTATLREAWQLPLRVVPEVDATSHKAAALAGILDDQRAQASWAGPAIDLAHRYAARLLAQADPSRQVVVHGDPHPGNLLAVLRPRAGAPAGHVFVDADHFRCEPEYDLGVLLREANTELGAAADPAALLRSWCTQVADDTGTDPGAVWRWAFLERVTTGLYLYWHDLPGRGEPFPTNAVRLARQVGAGHASA